MAAHPRRVARRATASYGAGVRVGLISDTHLPSLIRHLGELGPEVGEFLSTVDLILHGGDVSARSVLDWCEQFAPVIAARGNHDIFDDPRMEPRQLLELEGWRIGMTHSLWPERAPVTELRDRHFDGAALDILICGDTHVERLEHRDGAVIVNSGSPNLPHNKETRLGTVGLLELGPGRLRAEIITLGHTEGATNPGTARHLEIEGGRLVAASRDGVPLPVTDSAG